MLICIVTVILQNPLIIVNVFQMTCFHENDENCGNSPGNLAYKSINANTFTQDLVFISKINKCVDLNLTHSHRESMICPPCLEYTGGGLSSHCQRCLTFSSSQSTADKKPLRSVSELIQRPDTKCLSIKSCKKKIVLRHFNWSKKKKSLGFIWRDCTY